MKLAFRPSQWARLGLVLGATAVSSVLSQTVSDEALEQRVETVLESASDLSADAISVEVRAGVVTLSGSVVCDECGGSATPGSYSTVQQSLGAVVRAVPGVEKVEFDLRYRPRGSS